MLLPNIFQKLIFSSAIHGDVIKIGTEPTAFGTSSISLRCIARNKMTKENILTIDTIVFVLLGADGKPSPHGKTIADLKRNQSEE